MDTLGREQRRAGRRATDRKMLLGDLIRDPKDGMMSVIKTLSVGSWFVITSVTYWEAAYHSITSWDLMLYAMTTTICSGAPLASHVINFVQPRLAGLAGKYGPHAANDEKENGATTVSATTVVKQS